MLLDEPFLALDAITREEISITQHTLRLEERPTVLLIIHGVAEAAFLADRVVAMSPRPDRSRAGSPSICCGHGRIAPAFNAVAVAIHQFLR